MDRETPRMGFFPGIVVPRSPLKFICVFEDDSVS